MNKSETALKALIHECVKFPEKRKEFIQEGTVELLLKLCHNRTTSNLQLSSQALAILGILAHGDSIVKAKIVGQKALKPLLAFCEPQQTAASDVDNSVCRQRLLAHEQSSLLLRKLAYQNSVCQTELVNAGALKRLIGLCDVFNPTGQHANCCYVNQEFSEEAKSLLSELTLSKQLIGKIRELQGQEKVDRVQHLSEIGCPAVHCDANSRMLSVELFDTTTDQDFNIGTEMVRSGAAWPDLGSSVAQLEDGEGKYVKLKKKEVGYMWQDVSVTQVIDGRHFWAHVGGEEVRTRMTELSNQLLSQNLPKPEQFPQPGDMVCVNGMIGGHRDAYRAIILEIAMEQPEYVLKVLAVDYGYIAIVPGSTVRVLTTELASLQSQATLCCLAGIQAPPPRTHVLENAAGALRNLTQEDSNCRQYIAAHAGTEVLVKLCSIPNREVCRQASGALLNLALNGKNRARIGFLGGINTMFDLCHRYPKDDEVLELAVGTLQNLMIGSTLNRGRVVDSQGLIVLADIYHSTENSSVKQRALEAVKNLVGSSFAGNLNVEEAPTTCDITRGNVDVRNMMDDHVKKKFSLAVTNEGREDYVPAGRRSRSRRRRRLRKGWVEPNPTRVALPLDSIQRVSYSTGESDSENYLSGTTSCDDTDGDTDGENLIGSDSGLAADKGEKDVDNERYFVQGDKVPFVEDERHDFRTQTNVHSFNKGPVAKSLCAFLNSSKCGTVYFGIRKDAIVAGVVINRKERDMLRLGVDGMLDRFSPGVKHDCYKIEFVPVVRKAGHYNPITRITCQDRYVIEISITRCSGIVYSTPRGKCYFRYKSSNTELNTQDIREKTIHAQETAYNTEMRSLRKEITEMKRQLREKSAERTGGERQPGRTSVEHVSHNSEGRHASSDLDELEGSQTQCAIS